jgi:hypothetical protein
MREDVVNEVSEEQLSCIDANITYLESILKIRKETLKWKIQNEN